MNEMKSYSFFIRPLISLWMDSMGVDLFMTRTVHEILWGFKDPLMSKLHDLKPEVDEYFGLMYKVLKTIIIILQSSKFNEQIFQQ